ncbi:kinetochore and Eb1-associated basic protein [Drosophila rhopaloa]|uniref:Kinetochore and Eb1-associated basic protein n=1 Tax=Drosophila rhopaloa TaxID=1041015 RepID=A0ABM5H8B7_DRORH|nr:kinetochore and Eb1-associated basic protein [Drosophila rhopaloa]
MNNMAYSPDVRIPGFLTPLRSKELLERQRGGKSVPKKEYLTSNKPLGLEKPENKPLIIRLPKSVPSIIITDADLERPKELLQRLERSIDRSASTSKIPSKNAILTSQTRQRTWEGPKNHELRPSKIVIPSSEPCPLRSQKLLEDQRCRYRGNSATKISSQTNRETQDGSKTPEKRSQFIPCSEPQPIRPKVILERERQAVITNRAVSVSIDRPKTKPPTSSFTSSRQLVPSIGFSYPKDPKSLPTSSKATKLTNSKRKLDFHTDLGKDSLRQKLDRISKEWQKTTEYQLSQFIADFVKQLVRFLPFCGVKFSHLSSDCYMQQMMEALQQLHYAKKVSKSWLRMPITQKAFGDVLEMLHFLLNVVETRSEEGICKIPIISEKQAMFKQTARDFSPMKGATEYRKIKIEPSFDSNCSISNEIMRLQENVQNLKCQNDKLNCQEDLKPINFITTNEIMDGVTNLDYAILLDNQEERLHELQLHRLRLQEISELVSLAKLKLKRCCTGDKESIHAFNEQIGGLAASLLVLKKIRPKTQLHLTVNSTLDEINERKEQLQQMYEENYSNLLQLNI